jgi:FkbM family methyltransferase
LTDGTTSSEGLPPVKSLRAKAKSPLVYDIGLHDGRDTAHYLREGCRVVAIDANPEMCTAAEAEYRDYIQTGQLTVLNIGVAEHKGQFEFWVCDHLSEWSSFDPNPSYKHHAITVDCVPIMDIVDKFGVADYMKIDIEGNDGICIAGLTSTTAPKYISIELDFWDHGEKDIERLFELGYRGFKVVCQGNAWHQVTIRNIWLYQLGPEHLIFQPLSKIRRGIFKYLYGRRRGESGPWGEKTSGSWHSVDHAQSVRRLLLELHQRPQELGWWWDVHARK